MKYIKTYENFKPITINSAKPFKVKKGLLKNAVYLQKGIKSDRKRLGREKDPAKRTKLNNDKNSKIQKLKSISFKTLKQAEYLRNNPVKESYSDDEDDDKQNLIQILESPDFKPEDIVNYIGLDEKEYITKSSSYYRYEPEYDKDKLIIFMKSRKLEDLMELEEGIINHLLSFGSYGNSQDYYVDDDELDYIYSYLSEETLNKIKEFSKLFNYEIDPGEENEIHKLFNYLGLKSELDDFKMEIAMENERAIDKAARALIKSLPFELSFEHTGDFDIELVFDYESIIEYMKKHNMNVKTIKEFLENIYEASDLSYEFEEDKYKFMGDFEDLKKEVNNVINDYMISPDDIFPKLIEVDNLEAFKENFDKAEFNYDYDVRIDYDNKKLDLFNLARFYKGEILQWFVSPEFENRLKEEKSEDDFENYEQFIYKANAAKFNI